MNKEFSIGEIAILRKPKSSDLHGEYPKLPGNEVTVTGPLEKSFLRCVDGVRGPFWIHRILGQDGRTYGCPIEWLHKRKPPEDSKKFEAGDWDLCPWKPAIATSDRGAERGK